MFEYLFSRAEYPEDIHMILIHLLHINLSLEKKKNEMNLFLGLSGGGVYLRLSQL